jgi:hypothetical protein
MDYLLDGANGAAKAASDAASTASDVGWSQGAHLLRKSIELGSMENPAPQSQSQSESRLRQRKDDLARVPLGSSLDGEPITSSQMNASSPNALPDEREAATSELARADSEAAPAVAAASTTVETGGSPAVTSETENRAKVADVILTFLFRSGINVLKVGKGG